MPDLDYGYVVTIQQNATSDPSSVPTNQWQRKPAGGLFSDIAGETNSTYEIKAEDKASKIRLVQKLGGVRVFSNELQVTSADPPALASGYIGVHLKNAMRLKIRYDSPYSSVKFYFKVNESDPWVLDMDAPAGMNKYYQDDVPGYYAFESHNLVWCSFDGSHTGAQFDLLEESDFTHVTELNHLFANCKRFNQNVSWMQIPNVTTIAYMFANCNDMEGSVNFETPMVNNMQNCFEELNPSSTSVWNMDLSNWDTSKVTNFMYMFRGRKYFNHPSITSWDTSSARKMDGMFWDTTIFNQNLRGWCVDKIPTEPSSSPGKFSNGSALTDFNKPQWGAPC